MSSWALAGAWGSTYDYEKTRGCEETHDGTAYDGWYGHCKGDFPLETRKPGGCCGKRTQFRCVKACGDRIQYSPGRHGHPCGGAVEIKGVPVSISMHDKSGIKGALGNPQGAFWCKFNTSGEILKSYSGDGRLTTAGDGSRSIYDQLVFGSNKGSYKSNGFCADYKNINTVVHRDGRTCYDMLGDAADKKAKSLLYCKNNPRDPKCKCINVAGSGFVEHCKRNSSLPGCSEIIKGLADFQKIGVDTATGLYGNPDCIVPGICSGNVFQPLSPVPPCGNKIAICTQILKMDNISAAAGINSAQHCNINFAAEQKKKDDAAKAAQAAEQKKKDDAAKAAQAAEQKRKDDAAKAAQDAIAKPPTTPSQVAATKSNLPGGISRVQAAVGGGIFSFIILCIFAIILIVVATSGSKRRRR